MSLKNLLVACSLVVSALPVFAHEADANLIFDGEPVQVAVLSQQEMKETEGAWWVAPLIGGIGNGIGYSYGNPNWNLPGFTTAVGTGALGGLAGGVGGWGIGLAGSLYSTHVTSWY
ncbi:hypothetical protein RY831_26055 [Noviherbaspirillum sp. CPCC 100848]|uniref:Uncharacterized protein n=1 Tax=Noviherbaspirillum album TaxID=3080276 RepID=A0ABU6JH72_9BURK|nr:hypothetical protein [Noviherbaspirillum sp. CPCC 100848]MEC4722635.1 hypothetical protein [Noviherbaspirillum sp. CPCC 100848]